MVLDDSLLDVTRRIQHGQLHQEAIELRLGQRIGSLRLDRVLRRDHDERRGKRARDAVDGHLMVLHGLEQRRLRLGGRAVDFVSKEKLAENRTRDERERALLAVQDARSRDVARHEIRRELQALEARARHLGERARDQGFAQTRRAFDEDMTARDRSDEQAEDEVFLTDHHLRHLRADAPERGLEDRRRHAPHW